MSLLNAYNTSPHAVTQSVPTAPLTPGILELTGATRRLIGSMTLGGANYTRGVGPCTVSFRPILPLVVIKDAMHAHVKLATDEYLRVPDWLMPDLEKLIANNPRATDFKMIRTPNLNKHSAPGPRRGWDNYTIEILSSQGTVAKLTVVKRVIDPNKDCSCGGERTGYAKGNPGHAHWCAWRNV